MLLVALLIYKSQGTEQWQCRAEVVVTTVPLAFCDLFILLKKLSGNSKWKFFYKKKLIN